MDLEIRRRESTGPGANTHVETETFAKFELMDGAPVRGTQEAQIRSYTLSIWLAFGSIFESVSAFSLSSLTHSLSFSLIYLLKQFF